MIEHPLNQLLPGSRSPISTLDEWRSWETWRVSLHELETVLPSSLGISFLSNVSESIGRDIKKAISSVININSVNTSNSDSGDSNSEGDTLVSSLLANTDIYHHSGFPISFFSNNVAIGHRGVAQQNVLQQSRVEINGSGQFDISKICGSPFNFQQVSTIEFATNEPHTSQLAVHQVSATQISPSQISPSQVTTAQISPSQISPTQISPTQVNTAEIPFSGSVTLQQFLSSHNFNLQNTTVPTWTEFLQGTSPFNITLQITDLPTGQLAEAQITQFDQYGRPNGGTILIDDDANGIGWFIDPTPNDNSEYTTTLTDTA